MDATTNHFPAFRSRVAPLAVNDIDTDQIIPARFLKVTDKAGLGSHLFADWRYNDDGSPKPQFVLNQPKYLGACILFAGENFGCGSSREHAPWALVDFGFRAVISTSFADIFRNNALKNGLLPIVVDRAVHRNLKEFVTGPLPIEIGIDLEGQTVQLPDGKLIRFAIDGFARTCLIAGTDELGYLLRFSDRITAFEQSYAGTVG